MKIARTLRKSEQIRQFIEEDKRFVPINNRIFDDLYIHNDVELYPFHDDPVDIKDKLSDNKEKKFRITEIDLIIFIFLQLINYNKVVMYPDEIANYLSCSKKTLSKSINKLQRMQCAVTTKYSHVTGKREYDEHNVRVLSEKKYSIVVKDDNGKTSKRKMEEWFINFDTDWEFYKKKDVDKWKRINFFFVTIYDFDLLTNGMLSRTEFIVYLYLIRRDARRGFDSKRNFYLKNSTIAEELMIKGSDNIEKYLDNLEQYGYIQVNHPKNYEVHKQKYIETSREFKPVYNYKALDRCRHNLIDKEDTETIEEVSLDKWKDPF
jgi:DNA-binding MarR family transcriptional regulator